MPSPSNHLPRTLDEQAVVLHELHLSLQKAGFTQAESLALVGFVIVGGRDSMALVRRLLNEREPRPPRPPTSGG